MTDMPFRPNGGISIKGLANYGITSAMPFQAGMLTRAPLAFGGRLLPNDYQQYIKRLPDH
jgi:hypothetical protein